LSIIGKLFEKVILIIVQRDIEEKDLPSASQFDSRARQSTTLQCMRLMDHATLNFKINMSKAALFLDIEITFDITWHLGLQYKIFTLQFLITVMKLIGSFVSQRKFRVSVEGEISTPRDIQAGVPQVSVLPPPFTV
jgi:hypothetical protein